MLPELIRGGAGDKHLEKTREAEIDHTRVKS